MKLLGLMGMMIYSGVVFASSAPVQVTGPSWQRILASCNEVVNWPSLDSYNLSLLDMYRREYLCDGENGGPLAVLTGVETRKCEGDTLIAYLTLYLVCPEE